MSAPSRWVRDLLIIPVVVGVIVAAVTFGLPRLFPDKNELSYSVQGPTAYLDSLVGSTLRVEVNGVPTASIYAYRARIWNSGDKSLKDIPVRFVFNAQDSAFTIFSTKHNTTPRFEFGIIAEGESTSTSRRYRYELLNPKDEDIVTFITNRPATLGVYAKTEGLELTEVKADEGSTWDQFGPIAASVIGLMAALLSSLLKLGLDKQLAEAEAKAKAFLARVYKD